jgi:acyl transferase domain-containing protein/NAD(P)-dependent dehydrogenase (short-subunit alcohol dehydrogenase family)/acyl carrier protein
MGCLFPKAENLSRYWANICQGVDAIREIPPTHWNPDDFHDPDPKSPDRTYARRGGFLDPVDFPALDFGIAPTNLDATDTTQLLGLMVARAALEDAGYGSTGKAIDRERVNVVLGVTGTLELVIPLGARLGHPIWRRALKDCGVAEPVASQVVQRISDSYVGWQENSFPGLLGNVAAGRIANRLDLGGTNCVVDAACASSIAAVHLAILELAAGRCDVALTGGLDTFNDIFMYMCFSKTPALSPTGDSRPFSAAGDGTALGEGLGVLTLKRLDDARRDGDRIYAVIKGIGTSSDGKGNAVYAPSAAGQARCLTRAYESAGVAPRTVELVEAHGTGTKVGDAVELSALAEVYRSSQPEGTWCALGSVKSQIGHTKAAAGAAGLIKAALALHHKVLPPTIKVDRPAEGAAPGQTPFYVNTQPRPWLPSPDHPRRAAVSAFGFGGSNFHAILEEADPAPAPIAWTGDVQILAFSGATAEAITRSLEAIPLDASWDSVRLEAARSRSSFQSDAPERLVIVAEREGTSWPKLVERAKTLLKTPASSTLSVSPEGIYRATGKAPGGLAVLFPGQGSQYVGMLRDLACTFPSLLETLVEAGRDRLEGQGLADWIYPHPAFDDESRQGLERSLKATNIAQPAIGAVSLGAFHVLEEFGLKPDAFAGHSFGELTALCASGRIVERDFHELARLRGSLMAGDGGDRGGMLAVLAPIEAIEAAMVEEKLDLVVANRNAPRQAVLSGPSAEISRAATAFGRKGITTKPLDVSAAFHSRLVAEASGPLLEALGKVEVAPSAVPVFANSTAEPYPTEPAEARLLLAGQLAKPVRFVEQVEAMHRSGIRTFLEVGPESRLTGLVRAILEGREHACLVLDASRGSRGNVADLARMLAQVAAIGHPVQLTRWDEGAEALLISAKKPGLTVKVSGANFRPKPLPPVAPSSPAIHATPTPEPPPKMTPKLDDRPSPDPSNSPPYRNGSTPALANGHAQGTSPRLAAPVPPPVVATRQPLPIPASHLVEALRVSQENLVALQRISEQTSNLHRQYLEGQDRAQQNFQSLLEHQQRLTLAAIGMTPAPAPVPTASPAPLPIARPAPARVAAPPPVARTPSRREVPAPAPVPVPRPAPIVAKAPEPVPTPPPVVTSRAAEVHQALVEVVSEKTGYPAEVLEPGMQLDADLGIDSIKRVEILAALQERLPEAPVIGPEHLGTIRTLGQIAEFLAGGEQSHEAPSRPFEVAPAAVSSNSSAAVHQALVEVVSEKTGYPAEVLEPGMQLDADLGIDSIKRVEILAALQERLPEAPVIGPEHLGTIRTLGQIAEFLAGGVQAAPAVAKPVASPIKPSISEPVSEPVRRLVPSIVEIARPEDRPPVHLAADAELWVLDDGSDLAASLVAACRKSGLRGRRISKAEAATLAIPPKLAGLVVLDSGPDRATIGEVFSLLRNAAPALKQGESAFVTVSNLGGSFGLDGIATGSDPASGGLAGLSKTAGHEWPEVHCKAIDLDPNLPTSRAASLILEEMTRRGPAEVGLSSSGRSMITLRSVAIDSRSGVNPLEPGDLVVITGGARGVTAEVAVALAGSFRPTLAILGRSPSPTPEPDWLAALTDESEIKRGLHTRANGHSTPQAIGEAFRQFSANREVLANLRRIEEAGAKVVYRSVDVRDREAVGSVVASLRTELGPIRSLIHGAGVLADRKIEDQTDEQFARVYETKVGGLDALLGAIGSDDLRALVLFSSSTARFGRKGQVAYAAANEVLNKRAQFEAKARPDCRVLSVNWGPWAGGMVTPSLRPLFEAEGIALIPVAEGARYLVNELRNTQVRPVEVLILGGGGPDPDFLKPLPVEKPEELTSGLAKVFERPLDVASTPILKAHVMDGRPVLPMALILEWLAQAAMTRNPGMVYRGVDDLRLLKGVVLREALPETIRAMAGKATRREDHWVVPVELRGVLADDREVLHARGEVILGDAHPPRPEAVEDPSLPPYASNRREIYRDILFHGPGLHGIVAVEGCGDAGIIATVSAAPAPSEWVVNPLRNQWLTDPLALDCAFQMMILWSVERTGSGSLPTFIGRYRQFRRAFPSEGVRVVARITEASPHKARADVDFLDKRGEPVARIEDYECVIDASLKAAFRRNLAAQVESK